MFDRRQRSCCEKYADSVDGTNVRQRASSASVVRYPALTIWRVRKRSSPYLIGTPSSERRSSTGSSSTSTERRYAVRHPDRHSTRWNAHSMFRMAKYAYQYFTVCIRVSQLSCLLRTSTQPPTAAISARVNRRTSWRIAVASITTSESTETMISLVVCRTAWMIDRRLPTFVTLRNTVSRPCDAAATSEARAKLSSDEQSSMQIASSLSGGYSASSTLRSVSAIPVASLNSGITTVTVGR